MLEALLKLLNVRVIDASNVSHVEVMLRGPVGLAWVVLLMLLSTAGAFWLYRSLRELSSPRRWLMAGLRAAFLVLLLGLLLRPVLRLTVEGEVRQVLLLLLDGSASLSIADPRTESDDLKRVGIAMGMLDPARGLEQELPADVDAAVREASRLKLLQAVLTNDRLKLLQRWSRDFDIRVFSFGQQLIELSGSAAVFGSAGPSGSAEVAGSANVSGGANVSGSAAVSGSANVSGSADVAGVAGTADGVEPTKSRANHPRMPTEWVQRLRADAPVTSIGDALREALLRTRGQPLAGIVLATDGQNNAGSSPAAAAELARAQRVPLYVYGLGIANPKDIFLASLFAPDVAFLDDEITVLARVRSGGLEGESAVVVLRQDDRIVARQPIRFGEDGEQVVALTFKPDKPGDYTLTASIEPLPSEVVKDNNAQSQKLRVIDGKIRVLLVEQQPRWEYKYLQALLLRDRRVKLNVVLLDAGAALPIGGSSPYLAGFPTTKQELLEYDLVILGDVDPRNFAAGQLDSLAEYVSQFGGGLLVIAGRRHMPHSYPNTPIEKLLPVEWSQQPAVPASMEAPADKPIRPELTIAGRASLMLRLADNETSSAAAWAQLPPIYWTSPVTRAKPSAEVLLVDPDPSRATRFGKMPVMALQQYGLGQVMYVGTDNTWRWRRNTGDRIHGLFWGQVVQRLALPHLLGEAKRTQLSADKKSYTSGERVTVYARLYSASYEPIVEPSVRAVVVPAGQTSPRIGVLMRPLPGQPGMYRGEFTAGAPGIYDVFVEQDEKTRLEIPVMDARLETSQTAMNETLLREMSAISDGAFFREEDLYRLPDLMDHRTKRVRSTIDVEAWSSPLYFVVLMMTLTAEWVLRKMNQLK